MDVSTQPFAYSYHLENASIYNDNRFYINHNDKEAAASCGIEAPRSPTLPPARRSEWPR